MTSDVESLLRAGREVECCQCPVIDGVLAHDVVDGGRPGPSQHVDRPGQVHLNPDWSESVNAVF